MNTLIDINQVSSCVCFIQELAINFLNLSSYDILVQQLFSELAFFKFFGTRD